LDPIGEPFIYQLFSLMAIIHYVSIGSNKRTDILFYDFFGLYWIQYIKIKAGELQ
jgi:hypothetical protein